MKFLIIIHNLFSLFVEKSFFQIKKKENIQKVFLIAAALVSGVFSVAYAKLFKLSEEIFSRYLNDKKEFVFLITPILFLLSWWIVHRFSKESSGSGIPQVLLANEINDDSSDKKYIRALLSMKIVIFKTLSSVICVMGGGAIGREGPTIHISASIFYIFGKKIKQFLPESKSHMWIITGASAGLAAAFNTPLGGIIYAIEELGSNHFSKIRTSLLIAVITSGLISLWLNGNYLYLGFPIITYNGLSVIWGAVLIGLATGLTGGVFSQLLFQLTKARRKIKSTVKMIFLTLICGLLMASLIYYNSKSAGTGIELINDLLFHNQLSNFTHVCTRFLGTMITYLAGTAGGIFSPSLSIGGSIGGYFAVLFDFSDRNIFVLLGMIGFLTGVTKTPFTSFILVFEMTNVHTSIFSMMISALVAQFSSNLISHKSFYEQMKMVYHEEFQVKNNC
ncbi:MAG: chloride channel protein [Bacteriovoracaceae bacterium]